jgi:glycosyltransferase involved in cell wall biosynthesis
MSKPIVSVVLPVYNPGNFLAPAINSIIDQSYQDWELICVNDGCTDQSRETLERFAGQDKRIRVHHQENAGVVAAANRGCELARADLICRMDADDISMPNRIQHQVDFMQTHPEYAAVSGSILEIDTDSEPLGIQSLPCFAARPGSLTQLASCGQMLFERSEAFVKSTNGSKTTIYGCE